MSHTLLWIHSGSELPPPIRRALEKEGIAITTAKTPADAMQALRGGSFHACVVEEYLEDGTGLDFCVWARKQASPNLLLALIVSAPVTEERQRELRLSAGITDIWTSPVPAAALQRFCRHVLRLPGSHPDDLEVPAFMAELQASYRRSVPGKISALNQHLDALEAGAAPETLAALRMDLHKINGSAGSYGFHAASQYARALEQETERRIAAWPAWNQDWVESTREHVRALRRLLELPDGGRRLESPSRILQLARAGQTEALPDIYLIDSDSRRQDELATVLRKSGLQAKNEADPRRAMETIAGDAFHPSIVIVARAFAGATIDGYALIDAVRAKNLAPAPTIVMLSRSGEWQDRIAAVRHGVDLYMDENTSPEQLVRVTDSILRSLSRESFHVLAALGPGRDSDLVEASLRELRVPYRMAADAGAMMNGLEQHKTQLVIVSSALPHGKPDEWVRMLRADLRYRDLPVIVLLDSTEESLVEACFHAGADDVILPPLLKRLLSARIAYVIQRQALIAAGRDRDPLTGLFNRRAFSEHAATAIARAGRQRAALALAILDLDFFKTVNDRFGHAAGDDVLLQFSRLLSRSFRKSDWIGRWGGEEFVILLEGLNAVQAQFVVGTLLDELRKETLLPDHADVKITFSAGIASFPVHGESLDMLVNQADTALYQAKREGRNRVIAAPERDTATDKPVVLILDKDAELTQMLRGAFETRGFAVVAQDTLPALRHWLAARHAAPAPRLLLLGSAHNEPAGQPSLMQLRADIPAATAVLVLADRPDAAPLPAADPARRIDVLVKPFGIDTLMAKALQLMSTPAP